MYTFKCSEKIDNCLCHNCDLDMGKSNTGQVSGGNRDKRQSWYGLGCGYWHYKYNIWIPCPYGSVRRPTIRKRYTCTRTVWYINRCYVEYYIYYYDDYVCDCPVNIAIETCDGNSGDTTIISISCSISIG